MDLLEQKPQFSAKAFGLGKAVRVEDISYLQSGRKLVYNSKFKDLKTDAIIANFAPLELVISYWDKKEVGVRTLLIPVDLVADKLIEIKLMEVAP